MEAKLDHHLLSCGCSEFLQMSVLPEHVDKAISGAGLSEDEQVALTRTAERLPQAKLESWASKTPGWIIKYLLAELSSHGKWSCQSARLPARCTACCCSSGDGLMARAQMHWV